MSKFLAGLLVVLVAGIVLVAFIGPAQGVAPCFRTVALRQNYGYGTNYGYQATNYHAANYNYDQNVLIVGVPVANLGLPYYWSVGDDLREERIAKKTAELLRQGGGQSDKRDTRKPTSKTQPKEDSPRIDVIGGGAAGGGGEASTKPVLPGKLDGEVLAIFEASCASCHRPGKAIKGITLLTEDGQLFHERGHAAEVKYRYRVYDSVFGGDGVNLMPKNASPLPNDQVETIRNWHREIVLD